MKFSAEYMAVALSVGGDVPNVYESFIVGEAAVARMFTVAAVSVVSEY